MSGPELLALMAVVAGFVLVLRPIAGALAKRISGEHRRPEMDAQDRDELLTELQQVRHELAELAERMDFAERLLAKPRDAGGAARG